MIRLASFTRWRKVLVTAFLPYLLLSVFVDFVHLHRLINGPVSASSASVHLQTDGATTPKPPEAACAICQWMRAGAGQQIAVVAEQFPVVVTTALVTLTTVPLVKRDLGSPDFRGPPSLSL